MVLCGRQSLVLLDKHLNRVAGARDRCVFNFAENCQAFPRAAGALCLYRGDGRGLMAHRGFNFISLMNDDD